MRSRREFLSLGAAATVGAVLSACTPETQATPIPVQKPEPTTSTPFPDIERISNPIIRLGAPESVNLSPLSELPDIQSPFYTDQRGRLLGFVTAGQGSYQISMDRNSGRISLAVPNQIIGKDFTGQRMYRNGYTGIGSIYQPNPNNRDFLIAALNYEQHALDPRGNLVWYQFRGRIGIGISRDAGRTWEDRGVIIEGHDPIDPGTPSPRANNEVRPTGAIHPWFLPRRIQGNDYIYIYYTDLTSNINRPNQICLSRCTINRDGNLGTQELYASNGQFIPNGERQGIEPKGVFKTPPGGIFTAIPSVYYFQEHLLAMFESEHGFYMSKSEDGINWSDPMQIARYPTGINQTRAQGGRWFSNPTLVSPNLLSNSEITTRGLLMYCDGTAPGQNNRSLIGDTN